MRYCFLHAGPCSGWSDLGFSSKQIVPGLAIHAIACWTSTTKSREPAACATLKPSDKIQDRKPGFDAELQLCSGLVPSLREGFRLARLARSGSRDLVVDLQQAMACIALTFRPGKICFELKSRSEHGPRMQKAVTHSDS